MTWSWSGDQPLKDTGGPGGGANRSRREGQRNLEHWRVTGLLYVSVSNTLSFSLSLSHTHVHIEPRQKAFCNQTKCPLPRQQGLEELRVPRETWAVPAAMSVAPE